MALEHISKSGGLRDQKGQGVAEAVVALPAFLILTAAVFQLFFLGIAQIQLQYAAFYAARVGSVTDCDSIAMHRAVRKILVRSSGLAKLMDRSLKVETLLLDADGKPVSESEALKNEKFLKVHVHWNYPLLVPFIDSLTRKKTFLPAPDRPSIHLHASWVVAHLDH